MRVSFHLLLGVALPIPALAADADADGLDDAVDPCPTVAHHDPAWMASSGACVSPTATLGVGVQLGAGAVVGAGAALGDGVVVAPKAAVGAGASLGALSAVGRRSTVGAGVVLGRVTLARASSLDDGALALAGTQGELSLGYGATVGVAPCCGGAPSGVRVGDDVQVGNLARVGVGVTLGSGARVGREATLGDGVTLGDDARVGPDVQIGADGEIGDGASLRRGASLGVRAEVGVGAVIGRDVVGGADVRVGLTAVIRADATLADWAMVEDGDIVGRGEHVPSGQIGILASGGVRRFADGSMAATCEGYRRPVAPRAYVGVDAISGVYAVDHDGNGTEDGQVSCDQDTAGGGWTRCYTAASGTFSHSTWAMPGNTCFGSTPPRGGELLWRGASGNAVHIRAHAANHSGYQAWCGSMDALTAVGLARPIGTLTNFWTSGVCYLGGNNDVGSNIFYSWNHSCGGTATLSIGVTHGSGCDHEDYALGDLWVFYR